MKPMKVPRSITGSIVWLIPLLAVIAPTVGLAAERAKAMVTCQPTDAKLEYECIIMLSGRKSDKPISGAKILVSADMPSMAMAHNMRPVQAVPMGKPGMYKMRIRVEMMGEWALRLKISGPMRDLVITKYNFGTRHGMPAAHRNKMEMKEDGKGMKHGTGMKQKMGMKHGKGKKHKNGMKDKN